MGDSTGPNSFASRLARLLDGSTHSQQAIDSAVRDWERFTQHFLPISNLNLPKLLSAKSLAATLSGFSPRTSDRLFMEVSLPLPITPLTELYYIWHPPTTEFSLVMLPFDEWQQETGAEPLLLQHSFTSTGKPPLFWRTQYKLVPEFWFEASMVCAQCHCLPSCRLAKGDSVACWRSCLFCLRILLFSFANCLSHCHQLVHIIVVGACFPL